MEMKNLFMVGAVTLNADQRGVKYRNFNHQNARRCLQNLMNCVILSLF